MRDEWFYEENGVRAGPVAEAQLQAMAAAGTLRPETPIWTASMRQWLPAGQVTDWTFAPPPLPPASARPDVATSENPFMLTPRVIDLLRRTGPWTRFFAVLLYLSGGVFAILGLATIFVASAADGRFKSIPGGGMLVGTVYLLLATLYFVPATYLNRFASSARALHDSHRVLDLEHALDAQRALWKFWGVMTAIILAVYFLAIALYFGIL